MPVTFNRYNKFPEYFGDNTIDLDGDSFAAMLMNSSHVFTATHTQRANIAANQISTANGYTQATGGGTGKLLSSVTWVENAGTLTFDSADVSWSASGGPIAADDLSVFSDTAAGDELCFDIDFGGTQTAGDGTTFLVTVHVDGWFTLA